MGHIRILEENVINKIAAGEVIERPASVVKELIENSLDAEANNIKIIIKDKPITVIKVTDDGTGMDKNDCLLSVERHATSKLETAKDLFAIKTLGFRGEALASMAAIANVKITTKTQESETGYFVEAENTGIINQGQIGAPEGTTIKVAELFFNTPVRKNYLKGPITEFNKILDVVSRYALLRKDVKFTLIHNDKNVLSSQKTDRQYSHQY